MTRVTRSTEKKAYTCYDEYLCHNKVRKDMCRSCINYLDIPEKKKKQHEMGVRFACQIPNERGVELPHTKLPFHASCKRKPGKSSFEESYIESQDSCNTRPKKKTKHQVVVDQLNGIVRQKYVKLNSILSI